MFFSLLHLSGADDNILVACGMISQYNAKPGEEYGVKNVVAVVAKRLTIRGFIVLDRDMGAKYAEEHQKKMQKWIHEGTFKVKLSVTEGIDNAPDGLVGMLQGKNFGKAVLKIANLDEVSIMDRTCNGVVVTDQDSERIRG